MCRFYVRWKAWVLKGDGEIATRAETRPTKWIQTEPPIRTQKYYAT